MSAAASCKNWQEERISVATFERRKQSCNTDTLCYQQENLIYRHDATHKHVIKYTVVYEQQ